MMIDLVLLDLLMPHKRHISNYSDNKVIVPGFFLEESWDYVVILNLVPEFDLDSPTKWYRDDAKGLFLHVCKDYLPWSQSWWRERLHWVWEEWRITDKWCPRGRVQFIKLHKVLTCLCPPKCVLLFLPCASKKGTCWAPSTIMRYYQRGFLPFCYFSAIIK